jgi:pimeloyl-ACP methyl ester carboxylesterase
MNTPSLRLVERGRHLSMTAALVLALTVGVATRALALAQPGPLDITGEINGAPYRIVVPASWNGILLVFQRGYTDLADHPGEIDNRNPTIVPPGSGIRDSLLARGFALSGSARKTNGYSLESGLDDVVALVSYFRENVAMPEMSLLWGVSMGGLITVSTAERNGGAFDGFLSINAVCAGTPRIVDQLLVVRLAYDVTFGMPSSWGTVGDVRDDIDYETEALPIISAQASVPANFGRFEFIRLVAGYPGSGITPPPLYYPGALINSGNPFFLALEGEAELERRVGGPVSQNVTHTYVLTDAEKAYLAELGVDADPLLAAMNARRDIEGPPAPRNYIEHFGGPNGKIKRPVITIHTRTDQLAAVSNESAYRNTVVGAGREKLLFQAFIDGVGHGTFNATQQITGIEALVAWVKSGIRPTPADFPAARGFIPGFVPPAWPQPDVGENTASELRRAATGAVANAAFPNPNLEMVGSVPFRGAASLRYTLHEPAWVRLEVFGVDGRRVRTLVDRHEAPGSHTARFALNDGVGPPLASGVYFVRLAFGSRVHSLKIVGLD